MNNVTIMVDACRCTGCTRCAVACPYGYIYHKSGELGFPSPHMVECKGCGICLRECPFSDYFVDEDGE